MCFWLLLILLFLLALSTIPAYPYSRQWGYYPSGGFIVLLVILLILWWLAALPGWGQYPYWR